MSRKYSIIIVTWNACELIRTFLPSVAATVYGNLEIIIADNASTDDTVGWISENFPECKIVTFAENYGYCGGNNRAARYATGDILIFLNNDVRPEPDWLRQLDRVFDNPEVAAAQPKIRSSVQKDTFDYAGAAGGYLDSMAYPFCRGRIFQTTETDTGQYDEDTELFWASGAALAIRKELFDNSGGFDETFRFHMEEIDLCWRLLNTGYKIGFSHKSVVYHLGGGSLPTGSPKKVFYNFRNSLQMIWKNASGEWLVRRFFLRLCLDGVAGLRLLLSGQIKSAFAVLLAHFHFYQRWREVHRQRKALQEKRTVKKDPDKMIPVSIVREYYFRNRRTYHEMADENWQAFRRLSNVS